MKSKLKRFGIFSLKAIVVLLVIHAGLGFYWGRQVEAELRKLKTAGAPTTMADFGKTVIPDSENAAIVLKEVIDSVPKDEKPREQIARLFTSKNQKLAKVVAPNGNTLVAGSNGNFPETQQDWKQIEDAMAKLGGAPESAYRVIDMTDAQWPVKWEDGAAALFPHLAQMRELSRLVTADAILKARRGDKAGAIRSLNLALALPEKVGKSNVVIEYLVHIAMQQLALKGVRISTELAAFSPSELSQIAGYIHDMKQPDLQSALNGERAFGFWAFDSMRTQGLHNLMMSNVTDKSPISAPQRFVRGVSAYISRPLTYADQKRYLEYMAMQIDDLKEGSFDPEASVRYERKIAEIPPFFPISKLLTPVFTKVKTQCFKADAYKRMAVAALGLESYKRQKGQYPSSLDELKQIGWQKIEMDPFSQKPFIYNKQADGYLLYSVGENQKDDGGKGKSGNNQPLDLLWSDV